MQKSVKRFAARPFASVLILSILAAISIYSLLERPNYFYIWNIIPLEQPWGDLRVITAAYSSISDGINPYTCNPSDPWNRLYNYPRIWIYIGAVGPDNLYIVVLFFVAAFLWPFYWHARKSRYLHSVFLMAFLFSPAMVLLIERGNTDLFVMAMVLILYSSFNNNPIGFHLLATLIAVSKLYPIVLLIFKLVFSRFQCKLCYGSIGLFLLVFALTFDDIVCISRNTPRDATISYGYKVFNNSLTQINTPQFLSSILNKYPWMTLVALGSVALALAALHLRVKRTKCSEPSDLFLAGCGIYCITYAIGNNFDYRLSFLLLLGMEDWTRVSGLNNIGVRFYTSLLALVLMWWPVVERLLFHWQMPYRHTNLIENSGQAILFVCLLFVLLQKAGNILRPNLEHQEYNE